MISGGTAARAGWNTAVRRRGLACVGSLSEACHCHFFFFNRRDIPRGDRISITSIHITKEREKNRRRKKENTSVLSQEGVDVESNQKIMTNVMIVMRFRQLEIVTRSEGDTSKTVDLERDGCSSVRKRTGIVYRARAAKGTHSENWLGM